MERIKATRNYGERPTRPRARAGESLEWLAVAIIENAAKDWREYGKMRQLKNGANAEAKQAFDVSRNTGYATPRDELITFFRSVYFQELCEFVGDSIDGNAIIKHLGIPDTQPQRIPVQLELTNA